MSDVFDDGDGISSFWLNLDGVFDVTSDHFVRVIDQSGALASKDTDVAPLVLDEPVLAGDVSLTGRSDPVFGDVEGDIHSESGEHATATPDASTGDWMMTFATSPLTSGLNGSVYVTEPGLNDGDRTEIWWSTPFPTFTVHPESATVWGSEWAPASTITVTLIDVDGETVLDSFTMTSDTEGTFNPTEFDSFDVPVLAGHTVEVTDGTSTKNHVVADLTITEANAATDTISGTANPGAWIGMWIHYTAIGLGMNADESGNWLFDLSGLYDLVPGTGFGVSESDEDGDRTQVDSEVPMPPTVLGSSVGFSGDDACRCG